MLPDHERYRLHFGPYSQPNYTFGDIAFCEYRGEVEIIKQSDGRIPWPIGLPTGTGRRGRGSLIVFDELATAARQESSLAVSYWFGVSVATVAKWRKALGVDRKNAGTQRLFQTALSEDVDRSTKIAKSREGKPNAGYVAHMTGKKHTSETRKRMSEAQKRLKYRPWLEWEDQLLIDFVSVTEVAKLTKRHSQAIARRKKELGLPSHKPRPFYDWEDQLLKDRVPVYKIAQMTQRHNRSIVARQKELGLEPLKRGHPKKESK